MKLRSRHINPKIYQNPVLAEIEKKYQRIFRLFVGLWNLADREGLLEDWPLAIHGFIFPHVKAMPVEQMLSALAERGFIARYQGENGQCYIWITNFTMYQNVHPNEAKSVIPFPSDVIKCNVIKLQCNVVSKGKGKGISKGKEEGKDSIPFQAIITDLNKKSKKNYKYDTDKNKELIRARWNEGFKLKDFVHVNTVKCDQWLSTEQEEFIRPETLYCKKHFESYLNQRSTKQIEADEKFRKTEKCPECGNVGPVIEERKDYPDAKKYTGKEPIGASGSLKRFCYACKYEWNIGSPGKEATNTERDWGDLKKKITNKGR